MLMVYGLLKLLNHIMCSVRTMDKMLIMASTLALSVIISLGFVSSLFAQQNETDIMTSTNQTGSMMDNQTNQTGGGNQTQKGPLEQLGEAIGGVFGGGNQSK
jgi:hypothetical protein